MILESGGRPASIVAGDALGTRANLVGQGIERRIREQEAGDGAETGNRDLLSRERLAAVSRIGDGVGERAEVAVAE